MENLLEINRLFGRMSSLGQTLAIAQGADGYSYADLMIAIERQSTLLDRLRVARGDVIGIQSDFSLDAIALLLALFRRGCVAALLGTGTSAVDGLLDDAGAAAWFRAGADGLQFHARIAPTFTHPLLDKLRAEQRPGFVIFSSGSSGRPKAILHDLCRFLTAYKTSKKAMVTLAFLLFDHIAGLDTLFYTLHAGGSLVVPDRRTPDAVCALLARWRVEVLPVSPSFLKMLCLSRATERHDISSVRVVTYGSEPMDGTTLARTTSLLPGVRFRQKYGASEFGAPRVRTREDGLWIRLDGGDIATRVVDDVLWIRAPATMLGYLNAEPPRTQDGWLCTGDRIESDGEWIRVLGRETDIINVGGQKVCPSEVEGVIGELASVAQVAVRGEPHPLLGQIVTAMVRPVEAGDVVNGLRAAITTHCAQRLERYKVPVRITMTAQALSGERHKIMRV